MDILFWLGLSSYVAALLCGAAAMLHHAEGRALEGNANFAKLVLFGVAGLLMHCAWWTPA